MSTTKNHIKSVYAFDHRKVNDKLLETNEFSIKLDKQFNEK